MAEQMPAAPDALPQRLRKVIEVMREALNACEAALDEIELDARGGIAFDECRLREMIEALGNPPVAASSKAKDEPECEP